MGFPYVTILFMKKAIILSLFLMCSLFMTAQSIMGTWKTIDDNSGEERSYVEVYEKDGKVYGKITKLLDEEPASLICTECKDYRKDKPILGMEIITGMEANGTKNWKGGKIMDPENGKSYSCKLWLDDSGTLKVRGYLGPFFRTQTWYRVK